MKSRYDYTKKVKSDKGKTVTSSMSLVNIEPKDTDIYIITNATDRLDTLAYKYYGNVRYWWIIAMVNNINNGTMALPPNTRLLIPSDLGSILLEVERTNT